MTQETKIRAQICSAVIPGRGRSSRARNPYHWLRRMDSGLGMTNAEAPRNDQPAKP
jgi:hypothetical protein